MPPKHSVTVAKLPGEKAPYPYTAISKSPYGRLILIAGKDTVTFVSIKPSGLKEVKSLRISQFFQATRSIGVDSKQNKDSSTQSQKRLQLNEVFVPSSAQGARTTNITINITDVAWSLRQHHGTNGSNNTNEEQSVRMRSKSHDFPDSPSRAMSSEGQHNESQPMMNDIKKDPFQSIISLPDDLLEADDSLIAVAGSNGVVVVWRTCDMLGGGIENNWNQRGNGNIFGGGNGSGKEDVTNNDNLDHFQFIQNYMNHRDRGGNNVRRSNTGASSTAIGQPEAILVEHNRAVNRIAWHKKRSGVFITASQDGTVKMFERKEVKTKDKQKSENRHQEASKWKWFSKSDSSSSVKSYYWSCSGCFRPNCGPVHDIGWSNFDPDLFAMVTNNGFLVVHNINLVNNARPMVRIAAHAREATTLDWHPSEKFIIATGSVDRTVKVWDLESEISFYDEDNSMSFRQNTVSTRSHGSYDSGSLVSDSSQDNDALSHSFHGNHYSSFGGASSTLSVNMSSGTLKLRPSKGAAFTQIHELSVAAQVETLKWRPPKGINIDGMDHHAAMLAISTSASGGAASGGHGTISLWSCHRNFMPLSIVDGHEEGAVVDFIWLDTPEINEDDYYFIPSQEDSKASLSGTWQHVLSIGRDGKCIVQSLARGERPLSNVSPSVFAITNMSPHQMGFGSLQIISAHQEVPQADDYALCGLRCDEYTSLAPGFYMEEMSPDNSNKISKFQWKPKDDLRSVSYEHVHLNFHVTDCGSLNTLFCDSDYDQISSIKIAPEVVHLSRFAEGYKLCTDPSLPTKAAVCRFNAAVAATLKYEAHSKMWNMLASILEGIKYKASESRKIHTFSTDTMSFILHPTLKSLLLSRADAGDVQTCVVLCEVLDVIVKQKNNNISVAIPGLDILLVRQWYLSYIEILEQMCLFSYATDLIRNCKDPEIGKMNQTSTTIHEACPICAKPLQSGQKYCKNCRRKVGLCCLCHEPVTRLLVMCPGCGHSAHLTHAIEWYSLHEMCPTGCGHKCFDSISGNMQCFDAMY